MSDYEVYWFEVISDINQARKRRADELRSVRSNLRDLGIPLKRHDKLTEAVLRGFPHVPKPTAAYLRERANTVMACCVEPIRANVCGQDDAEGVAKEAGRQWAFAAFEAAVRLEEGYA